MTEQLILIMKKLRKKQSSFGKRLRELREARGLTQAAFGRMVGLSQRMVGHYENYSNYPPVDLIPRLAQALKVTTDELLGMIPIKDGIPIKDRKLARRFQKVGSLPLRAQRSVFALVNALCGKQSSSKNHNGFH